MKALTGFYRRGAEDADRRVAAALGPVATDAADRYLQTSRGVRAIDLATRHLRDGWLASETGRALSTAYGALAGAPTAVRHRTIASVLLIAVLSHLGLMLMQGPRPGWFWVVIPAMVAMFAALLLAGSKVEPEAD